MVRWLMVYACERSVKNKRYSWGYLRDHCGYLVLLFLLLITTASIYHRIEPICGGAGYTPENVLVRPSAMLTSALTLPLGAFVATRRRKHEHLLQTLGDSLGVSAPGKLRICVFASEPVGFFRGQ